MLIYGLVILIIQDVYCVPGQMSLLQQGGQSCLLLRRGRSTNPKYICLHSTGANDLEQIILVCIVLYCIVLYLSLHLYFCMYLYKYLSIYARWNGKILLDGHVRLVSLPASMPRSAWVGVYFHLYLNFRKKMYQG